MVVMTPLTGGFSVKKKDFQKGFFAGAVSGAVVVLLICGICGLALLGAGPFASDRRMNLLAADAKLRDIERLVDRRYLHATSSDAAAMQEYLYKGAAAALNDPYAAYYTREELIESNRKSEGHYSGIGVQVTQDTEGGDVSIVNVYAGGPAAEAGIQPGDILKTVDGTDVSGIALDSLAADYILGEDGTELTLTLYRPSSEETYTCTLTRRDVEIQSVSYEMLKDGIGLIQVTTFNETTPDAFNAAIDALSAEGMRALVIDLRDNTGGILGSAVQMLGRILPDGLLVRTADRDEKGDRYVSRDGQIVFESDYGNTLSGWPKEDGGILSVPIVLLVNGRTASASELFAQALRDYGAAKLVGTKTFGKGIVQNTFPLGDGTAFKMTTASYFTESGYLIQGQGILPDAEVEDTRISSKTASGQAEMGETKGAETEQDEGAKNTEKNVFLSAETQSESPEDAQLQKAVALLKEKF